MKTDSIKFEIFITLDMFACTDEPILVVYMTFCVCKNGFFGNAPKRQKNCVEKKFESQKSAKHYFQQPRKVHALERQPPYYPQKRSSANVKRPAFLAKQGQRGRKNGCKIHAILGVKCAAIEETQSKKFQRV